MSCRPSGVQQRSPVGKGPGHDKKLGPICRRSPPSALDGGTDIYERSTGQPLISSIAYGGPLDAPEVEHLELPPSPVPEVEEQLEPEVQEQLFSF